MAKWPTKTYKISVIGGRYGQAPWVSTAGLCFGPVFHGDNDRDAFEQANDFLSTIPVDPRYLTDQELSRYYGDWIARKP